MFDQANRLISLTSPLDANVLLFYRMTAVEQMGRLFEYRLEMLSENFNIELQSVLGKKMTVHHELPSGEKRHFNGYVSQFTQVPSFGQLAHYHAVLRPWTWFLTRHADCRIFQEMNVPDIVKDVFRRRGFSDFDDRLSGTYTPWVFCVQYRETDFNFVCRLMEQEGIYFYFRHEEDKHTLVLADAYASHDPITGYETVPYFPPGNNERRRVDHIHDLSVTQEVQPGGVVLDDFNFETPSADLQSITMFIREHENADGEIYDYPGEYSERGRGEQYSGVRIEEFHAQYERVRGTGNARGIIPGGMFSLEGYPRDDQNREYLVTQASYHMQSDAFETGHEAPAPVFRVSFKAIDSSTQYRPSRVTPKPVVQGPQTAMVTGKAGEEIWTDRYGRVKVKFPWDRHGTDDQDSSCWVRVAQLWAGKQWGAMFIPRIGQEVIVEFLEGDPDRPIITGRVYNAESMPPYALNANQTQSGIKTRSTKGGSPDNFNEIRFEDKKGSEELYIHAEKDQHNEVENNAVQNVGVNRTRTVGANEKEEIGSNKTIKVGANHKEKIGANRELKVMGNEDIKVVGNRNEFIGGNRSRTIAANRTDTIGGAATTTVAANHDLTVGGVLNELVAASGHTSKAGAFSEFIAGAKAEQILGASVSVHGGIKIEMFAGAQISTASGIKVEKGPAKQWDFPLCTVKASKVDIDGANITIKAASIKLEGTVKIEGSLTVTGAVKNGSVNAS